MDCLVLLSNISTIDKLTITSFQLQHTKVIHILFAFLTYSLYKIVGEFNYLCFTVRLLCKNSTLVNITINTKWSKCFQQLTHIVVFELVPYIALEDSVYNVFSHGPSEDHKVCFSLLSVEANFLKRPIVSWRPVVECGLGRRGERWVWRTSSILSTVKKINLKVAKEKKAVESLTGPGVEPPLYEFLVKNSDDIV